MRKEELETQIVKLTQAVAVSAGQHNALVGKLEAYKELLLNWEQHDLNDKESSNANEKQSAESIPAQEPAGNSEEV